MNNYTPFRGRYFDTIFEMEKQGMRPLKVEELIMARLEAAKQSDKKLGEILNSHTGTIDAILYHPDGRIKLLTNPDAVIPICLKCKSVYDSYELFEGMFEQTPSIEFQTQTPSCLLDGKYRLNTGLIEEEVLSHPIWEALVKDRQVLKEYMTLTKEKSQHLHGPLSDNARKFFEKTSSPDEMKTLEEKHDEDKGDCGGE
jgi:hypothetical protein